MRGESIASGDQYHTHLIFEILQGQTRKFETIMELYQEFVASLVFKHISHQNVLEVAHSAFIRVFQSLRNYKEIQPFKHWLSRIVLNTCYDFWRERYRVREVQIGSLSDESKKWLREAMSERAEEAQAERDRRREISELLDWALDKLGPEDRMVLTMTYFEDRTVAEVADFMGWSESNVKTRAHRARRKLRMVILSALAQEGKDSNDP